MNLLLLTHEGKITGSTNSIAYLACGLAERGHNVYLGCKKSSHLYRKLIDSKVHLIPMSLKGKLDFNNIREIRDAVRKYNIELINPQSSYDRYTTAIANWWYNLNVKVIYTRRQAPKSMGGWLQNTFYVKSSDKIVAVSHGVKEELINLGLPADHIEVIYNGTPKAKYENVEERYVETLKSRYNIKENDFVIGCISRLKEQKQILEALKFVNHPCKVIFVGIRNTKEFESIINSYTVPHEVYFEGLVPMNRSICYYKLFSVKILASTMEGLSQSLLEAMSMGVPVIATNYAGNKDLVKDGQNGLLFENKAIKQLADKIELLYSQPAIRQKLISAGKKTALEDFSIERTVENYERFFERIIKNNS